LNAGARGDTASRKHLRGGRGVCEGVYADLPALGAAALHAAAHHVAPAKQVRGEGVQRHETNSAAARGTRGFSAPLDEGRGLKLHRLLPVPRHRAFVGGDFALERESEPRAAPEHVKAFIPGHAGLSLRVASLHARLQTDDEGALVRINAHLPCASVEAHHERFVLLPEDAPQLGTLPDLGYIIRAALATRRWGETHIGSLLHACFPGQRCVGPAAPEQIDHASCCAGLSLLLGTLLAVYPTALKRPPFATRARLYARLHELLTQDSVHKADFMREHPGLFVLATLEYVLYVLPRMMPAEAQVLGNLYPLDALAAQAPAVLDAFRQNQVDTGDEAWTTLDTAAREAGERILRLYKARPQGTKAGGQQQQQQQARRRPGKRAADAVEWALDAHVVRPYPYHRADHARLCAEYELAVPEGVAAATAELHACVTVSLLPGNIKRMQEALVREVGLRCERKAKLQSAKYVCIACEHKRRRTMLRLCSRTGEMMCQHCHDTTGIQSVLRLCAVGRIIRIHDTQFYLTLCCGTVQPYTEGVENDLLPVPQLDPHALPCRHARPGKPEHRKRRPPCAMCDANAMPARHVYLHHLTGRMVTTQLCQRHTPPEDTLRRALNLRQFQDACNAWEKRPRAPGRR